MGSDAFQIRATHTFLYIGRLYSQLRVPTMQKFQIANSARRPLKGVG